MGMHNPSANVARPFFYFNHEVEMCVHIFLSTRKSKQKLSSYERGFGCIKMGVTTISVHDALDVIPCVCHNCILPVITSE